MYSIDKNITTEYIINKSKFIVNLFYIENSINIEKNLNKVKEEYKDATHYCYAYIVNGAMKMSDDGEPSGTAGLPILNVLKKNNLNNILCVVVRYFGGIKLGSGGLVRAYSNCVSETLKNNIVKYIEGYKAKIVFDYSEVNNINFILKDCKITYKEFNDTILYEFLITKKLYETIKNELKNICILGCCYIKEDI